MDTTTSKLKILRVGLVHKGKVIDERLLRQKRAVTLGESTRNTFVISAMDFPARFPLFEIKNEAYYLNYPDWMQGKLSHGSMAYTLSTATEKLAKPAGQVRFKDPNEQGTKADQATVYQIKLDEKSRGVLKFGEFSLLFQFVTPPPKPKEMPLPAALKGGFWKGNDWVYSSILLLSFVAHTTFVYWCKITGELPAHHAKTVSDRFPINVPCGKNCQKKKPKPIWKSEKEKKPKARKDIKSTQKVRKTRRRSRNNRRRGKPQPRKLTRAQLQEKLGRTGILVVIGSKGKKGVFQNFLRHGDNYGKALDKTLSKVTHVQAASASNKVPKGTRRAKGLAQKESGLGEGTPGRGGTLTQPGTRRKRARVKFEVKEIEGGTLPHGKAHALKSIRRYQRSLQYCYERALKTSPGLSGKVLFSITVALSGRVSSVELEENGLNGQAGACMTRSIKRWRLFKPKNEAVTLSVPFVFFAR